MCMFMCIKLSEEEKQGGQERAWTPTFHSEGAEPLHFYHVTPTFCIVNTWETVFLVETAWPRNALFMVLYFTL